MTVHGLNLVIHRVELDIRSIAKRHVEHCIVDSFGPVDINPGLLAIWIKTKTDAQRDLLLLNQPLLNEFRSALRLCGYPEDAVPRIGFSFQSQETVDRDFHGHWGLAMR